jgi:transcriptional regulator with XRE-family HTH domain
MPPKRYLQPEDYSLLGKFVLQYAKEHKISMNELARQAGISQPGLRAACLKGACPTDATLQKLSKAIGKPVTELYDLLYKARIEELQNSMPDAELPDSFSIFARQLFEAAKELGLAEPEESPSKENFQEALRVLGFSRRSMTL